MKRPLMLLVPAMFAMAFPARADDPVAAARAAFNEGRRLEAAGEYAAAVAQFEESSRLSPAVGTTLNLATCYQKQGRLMSAWRTFAQGAAEAARSGQTNRALRAQEHADALAPRLSSLSVVVATGSMRSEDLLEIRVDDHRLEAATLARPLPLDGGVHTVVVSVAGYRPWSTDIRLAPEGEHATVIVPQLAPAVAIDTAERPGPLAIVLPERPTRFAAPVTPAATATPWWTAPRIASATLFGAATLGLGVGTFYGLRARAQWEERLSVCPGDRCGSDGYALTAEARSSGTTATVGFIVGGALLASGLTLLLWAPKSGVTVTASPRGSGALLEVGGSR